MIVAVGLVTLLLLGAFYLLQTFRLRDLERELEQAQSERGPKPASSAETESAGTDPQAVFVTGLTILAAAAAGGVLLLAGIAWGGQNLEKRKAEALMEQSLTRVGRVETERLSEISLATLSRLEKRGLLVAALSAKLEERESPRPTFRPRIWNPPYWWEHPPPWWPETPR
jgi:hypothetical protein